MSEEQGDVVTYGQPVGYGQAVGVGLAYEPPPNNDLGNGGTAAAAGHSASASDESQLLLATQTSVQHEPQQASPAGALLRSPLYSPNYFVREQSECYRYR